MSQREFKKALLAARDAINDAELPRGADRRLKARLFEGAVKKPRWNVARVGFAAAFAVVLCVFAAVALLPRSPRMVGGFETVAAADGFAPVLAADGAVEVAEGTGVLFAPEEGASLAFSAPASVRRQADGVRVLRGEVAISVQKRPRAQGPVRIHVSGGTIEVFGTRFTVKERGSSGEVRLEEGSIGFRTPGGELQMLTPGNTLQWPPPVVEAPKPELQPEPVPMVPAPKDPPRKRVLTVREETMETDALLRKVASLRTRGQFGDAVALLQAGLTQKLRPRSREVLSYELGSILTSQVRDVEAACAHWNVHQRAHPKGRFETEIGAARRTLGCP
jgi:transmembrane sensor